jgi:hypothetical protein
MAIHAGHGQKERNAQYRRHDTGCGSNQQMTPTATTSSRTTRVTTLGAGSFGDSFAAGRPGSTLRTADMMRGKRVSSSSRTLSLPYLQRPRWRGRGGVSRVDWSQQRESNRSTTCTNAPHTYRGQRRHAVLSEHTNAHTHTHMHSHTHSHNNTHSRINQFTHAAATVAPRPTMGMKVE